MSEAYKKYVEDCEKLNKTPKPFNVWDRPVEYTFRTIPESEIQALIKPKYHTNTTYVPLLEDFIKSNLDAVEVNLTGALLDLYNKYTGSGNARRHMLVNRIDSYIYSHKLKISIYDRDNKLYLVKRK